MRKRMIFTVILFLLVTQTGCAHFPIWETAKGESDLAVANKEENMNYADFRLLHSIGTGSSHSLEGAREAIGLAAAGGNTDMMNLLFTRGYQLNESSLNNALRLACESGNTEAVDLLVEEAERQRLKADFYDGGKLNSAAGRHDLEMVKHLLENYHLDIGYLGMRWAVERNDVEMVELLLSYGAELNPDAAQLGDNMGYLGCAASSAGLEMVQLLVEAGAEVDGTYWNGVTPAMDAAYVSVRILKYLTEQGADINARSGYNDTPLMYAVWGKNRECVEFLLSEGADDSVVSEGQTAYEMAIERDDQESIKIFKKYGKDK